MTRPLLTIALICVLVGTLLLTGVAVLAPSPVVTLMGGVGGILIGCALLLVVNAFIYRDVP